jgi:hypothetical protein
MEPLQPHLPTLQRNLAALARRDATLAERITWPVDDAHVRRAPEAKGGGIHYRLGRSWLPLAFEVPEATLATLGQPQEVLVFGIGLGESVQAALTRWPQATIVAWDRDPWLLRVVLGAYDWSECISAGRLRLRLGSDLHDLLPWRGPTVHHPLLKRVYTLEAHLLEHGLGTKRALLATGELFVDDLAEALRARGYTVLPWELQRHAREEVAHTACGSAAELALAINYRAGLAEGCREADLPLICWEVDPAVDHPRVEGGAERAWVFTHDPHNVPRYRAGGFQNVEHMALATNPTHRFPDEAGVDPSYQAPVSFVGASMIHQARRLRVRFDAILTRWCADQGAETPTELVPRLLTLQRQHPSRFVISEALDAALPGFRQAFLAAGHGDPGLMLGETAAAEKRLNTVAGLGPLGAEAWGDPGWKLAERGGARYRGRAGHGREINRIYQGSTVSLDIGRIYQQDIVTMRVFDVLACGGFVLAEHSPHIHRLFDLDSELVTWRGPQDLERKVRHFLDHPEEAAAIARRGRARVLRDHTVEQRLSHMLRVAGLGGDEP